MKTVIFIVTTYQNPTVVKMHILGKTTRAPINYSFSIDFYTYETAFPPLNVGLFRNG